MLATLVLTTSAQQYFFKNYSVESGLPFVQVSCLYQDHNGYLWSGGYGGLSRFDGKVFLNYNRKNGMIDHNVNAICEGDSGDIFVGTSRGLSVLRRGRFLNYDKIGSVIPPSISSFCKGYHNSVYVGSNRGLFMFKNKQLKPIKKLEGYDITCLFNPDTSVIYIGTDKGLVLYGHNTFKVLNHNNGLCSDKITCIAKFKNFMVIGTVAGLSMYNLANGKIVNYFIENGLIDENITSVNTQDDILWIGSRSGLMRFNGRQFDYYNIDSDNNSNEVRCILRDREDNIWLGTHSGLYKYRDNSFSTFDKNSGVGTSFIYQVFRDRKGNLWVGTQNNGIYRGVDNSFRRYGAVDGVTGSVSRAGLEDREGRLIFGTQEKLVQFRDDHFYPIPLPAAFKGPYDELYLGRNNTVWIGGTNGFASLVWEGKTPVVKFYPIEAKTDFAVFGFCEDNYGNLYIGTYKAGLYRLLYGGRSLVNLSSELKLNEDNFFSLRFAKDKVFAASLNGLLVLDTKTNSLKKITDANGLNSELVYSIEITRDKNNMWIGTNQGVNKLNLKWYLNSGLANIVSFGKQEGFTGVECNTNGIWEDEDGTVWFGTVVGLVKHQPFNFKKNTVENTMLIQKLQVMNEDTILPDSCVLPSDYNTIAFYYRGICLTNPNKVLYQKKLEGLDKDWSAPSSEDYIKYTNLAPGKYTFMVRSGNNEGIWNNSITKFSFEIKSPFYLTWWFLLIGFICVFALIYLVFMIRIINIKKKQHLDFERKVEMSKIELKALRSQMNPHFIFNSLNSIQHYIFNTRSDEAIKYLNKFARLVRIILNNSEKSSVTVQEDLEALRLYVDLEQMRFEDKFDYEIVVDDSVDVDYDIMPPLLMQPYVENAILHGLNPKPEKGKLTIALNSKNNFLICTITDNGIGREKAAEIKRTMPYRKHKSMGMKITEDRLKILNEINNSQLSVTITDLKDSNGKAMGTRVQLFVPLNG